MCPAQLGRPGLSLPLVVADARAWGERAGDARMAQPFEHGSVEDALRIADLPPLTVTIQAGGESRRMGRSKATVPFLGRPLMERIVGRLAPIAGEVLVTTNEPENLGFLDAGPWADKVRLMRDIHEGRGALAGMHTALASAAFDCLAVCACDMVFASPELFWAQYEILLADAGLDVVVPRTEFGFEPFHAVYRRSTCLTAAQEALARGEKSMRSMLERLRTRDFTVAEVHRVVPQGRCFLNTNTPEELAKAESIAREVELGQRP